MLQTFKIMDVLESQLVVNCILLVSAVFLIIAAFKISNTQDAMKDKIDDIYKKLQE